MLAATILLVAANAGLIGISRLSWSLAEHHQLPGAFARVFGRGRTPAIAILFFAALAIVLMLPGEATLLGNLYSFGALLSFTIAHVSLVALRYREPDHERPYRAPWNVRLRGQHVSLTAILGGIGTFGAWVSLVILHPSARYVGLGWMAVGLCGYLIDCRRLGADPRVIHRRGLVPPDHASTCGAGSCARTASRATRRRLPRFTRERRRWPGSTRPGTAPRSGTRRAHR